MDLDLCSCGWQRVAVAYCLCCYRYHMFIDEYLPHKLLSLVSRCIVVCIYVCIYVCMYVIPRSPAVYKQERGERIDFDLTKLVWGDLAMIQICFGFLLYSVPFLWQNACSLGCGLRVTLPLQNHMLENEDFISYSSPCF